MSERSRRTPVSAANLPEHVREGLHALISTNVDAVAEMLDAPKGTETAESLCDNIAKVMSTQRLSAATVLGRFFSEEMLSEHAISLGKSGKGNSATIADRIVAQWKPKRAEASPRKRKAAARAEDGEEKQDKRKGKKAAAAKHDEDDDQGDEGEGGEGDQGEGDEGQGDEGEGDDE